MRTVDQIIDEIIQVEGGYVNDPADLGGETKYGITEAVAREHDYYGPMEDLPESKAREIYHDQFYHGPGFHRVAKHSQAIAVELTDTGVNMGPPDAVAMLQTTLNAFNDQERLYADINVDGYIGNNTIAALAAYMKHRGREGERVMLVTLNCLQGAEYVRLTSVREKNERFAYGWIRARVELCDA